jgi:hypothetical protein
MSDDELLDSLDRELLLGLCNRPADCPSCRERWSKIGALRRLRSLRGNHVTRERIEKVVGELMDGIRGATGGHEPFDRVWLTDRLCRLLGVEGE